MTLGKRLKRLRGKKTQLDIANSLSISRARYSHYENDHVEPDHDLLRKMAEQYHVSTDFLLTGMDAKESANALPKSPFDLMIDEVELRSGVTLRDDPFVLETVRNMLQIIAETKKPQ